MCPACMRTSTAYVHVFMVADLPEPTWVHIHAILNHGRIHNTFECTIFVYAWTYLDIIKLWIHNICIFMCAYVVCLNLQIFMQIMRNINIHMRFHVICLVHVSIYVWTYKHIYIYTYTHTHLLRSAHTYIHTYTHTHTYIYTYIYICLLTSAHVPANLP
jgi:hypothetical protein